MHAFFFCSLLQKSFEGCDTGNNKRMIFKDSEISKRMIRPVLAVDIVLNRRGMKV